ncbi:MAG: hypothetical protein ACTSU4_10440 [Promethearchaeota archaeon]
MESWLIADRIYSNIITIFFLIFACILFFIANKGFKSENRYGASSTIACGIIFIIFALYNAFIGFFVHPFNGFLVFWIGIIAVINLIFIFLIKIEIKKINQENNTISTEAEKLNSKFRKYVRYLISENPYKEHTSLKTEVIRKSFHLLGFLIVIAYYGFFFIPPITMLINNGILDFIQETRYLYSILWGDISTYPYGRDDFRAVIDLTLFILVGALFFAIIIDSIRNLFGPQYSILNILTRAVLRKKELNSSGPQIHLISGVLFSYILYLIGFVSAAVVFSAITIACISDALTAVVGKKCGKHKVRCLNGQIKSVEGFSIGFISAYIFALFFMGPIYALIAAIVFLLIDYFPLYIADNILNPIILTVSIGLFYVITGIPIGW